MPAPSHFALNPAKPMMIDGEELTVGTHLIMAVALLARDMGRPVLAREECMAVVAGAERAIRAMLDLQEDV